MMAADDLKKVIISGAPASGKGTQCERISKEVIPSQSLLSFPPPSLWHASSRVLRPSPPGPPTLFQLILGSWTMLADHMNDTLPLFLSGASPTSLLGTCSAPRLLLALRPGSARRAS